PVHRLRRTAVRSRSTLRRDGRWPFHHQVPGTCRNFRFQQQYCEWSWCRCLWRRGDYWSQQAPHPVAHFVKRVCCLVLQKFGEKHPAPVADNLMQEHGTALFGSYLSGQAQENIQIMHMSQHLLILLERTVNLPVIVGSQSGHEFQTVSEVLYRNAQTVLGRDILLHQSLGKDLQNGFFPDRHRFEETDGDRLEKTAGIRIEKSRITAEVIDPAKQCTGIDFFQFPFEFPLLFDSFLLKGGNDFHGCAGRSQIAVFRQIREKQDRFIGVADRPEHGDETLQLLTDRGKLPLPEAVAKKCYTFPQTARRDPQVMNGFRVESLPGSCQLEKKVIATVQKKTPGSKPGMCISSQASHKAFISGEVPPFLLPAISFFLATFGFCS